MVVAVKIGTWILFIAYEVGVNHASGRVRKKKKKKTDHRLSYSYESKNVFDTLYFLLFFFFFMNVQQQASAIFNIVQLYVTKGH